MKTRIVIEIETEFGEIFPREDGELDLNNPVTDSVEKDFHSLIDMAVRDYIDEDLERDVFDYEPPEYAIEEADSFNEYGKFTFKIITEKVE